MGRTWPAAVFVNYLIHPDALVLALPMSKVLAQSRPNCYPVCYPDENTCHGHQDNDLKLYVFLEILVSKNVTAYHIVRVVMITVFTLPLFRLALRIKD